MADPDQVYYDFGTDLYGTGGGYARGIPAATAVPSPVNTAGTASAQSYREQLAAIERRIAEIVAAIPKANPMDRYPLIEELGKLYTAAGQFRDDIWNMEKAGTTGTDPDNPFIAEQNKLDRDLKERLAALDRGISAGRLSLDAAQNEFRNALDQRTQRLNAIATANQLNMQGAQWAAPEGMTHFPGFGPGEAAAQAAKIVGANYTPIPITRIPFDPRGDVERILGAQQQAQIPAPVGVGAGYGAGATATAGAAQAAIPATLLPVPVPTSAGRVATGQQSSPYTPEQWDVLAAQTRQQSIPAPDTGAGGYARGMPGARVPAPTEVQGGNVGAPNEFPTGGQRTMPGQVFIKQYTDNSSLIYDPTAGRKPYVYIYNGKPIGWYASVQDADYSIRVR